MTPISFRISIVLSIWMFLKSVNGFHLVIERSTRTPLASYWREYRPRFGDCSFLRRRHHHDDNNGHYLRLYAESTGPKAEASGRRRRPPSRRGREQQDPTTEDKKGSSLSDQGAEDPNLSSKRSDDKSSSLREQSRMMTTTTRRRMMNDPFDGKTLTAMQRDNEDAPPLDLERILDSPSSPIRCMADGNLKFGNEISSMDSTSTFSSFTSSSSPCFRFYSLNDLFDPELGISERFNADSQFRQDLRMAIRQDIFDTTPFYQNLSEKAKSVLLLPDSSLEGSWRIPNNNVQPIESSEKNDDEEQQQPQRQQRMKQTTQVLQRTFGDTAPTGDDFIAAIGALCGSQPSTHFIDIFGVQDRRINHSWHLDSGRSPDNSRTVLLGFPAEDDYIGCGVFSHIIPLQRECLAPEGHPRNQPVLFAGTMNGEEEEGGMDYIVRPRYEPGRELISYRDIDVLHSVPDVTYRMSIMRFM